MSRAGVMVLVYGACVFAGSLGQRIRTPATPATNEAIKMAILAAA